jgi:hypothetical protein
MSLEDFYTDELDPHVPANWGTEIEKQIRLRIKLSIAAYAYEFNNDSIMSDSDFDKECLKVDVSMDTGNKKLDEFFRNEFDPSTGQWIHKHPETHLIKELYFKYYCN